MNGNTSILRRAIIGAQSIPNLKPVVAIVREKEKEVPEQKHETLMRLICDLHERFSVIEKYFLADKVPLIVGTEMAATQYRPTMRKIIIVVARYYEITPDNIISRRQMKLFAFPRQVAMYLGAELTLYSTGDIGRILGNRDHSTVMYGIGKIGTLRRTDAGLNHAITELKKILTPNEPAPYSIPQGAGSLHE